MPDGNDRFRLPSVTHPEPFLDLIFDQRAVPGGSVSPDGILRGVSRRHPPLRSSGAGAPYDAHFGCRLESAPRAPGRPTMLTSDAVSEVLLGRVGVASWTEDLKQALGGRPRKPGRSRTSMAARKAPTATCTIGPHVSSGMGNSVTAITSVTAWTAVVVIVVGYTVSGVAGIR